MSNDILLKAEKDIEVKMAKLKKAQLALSKAIARRRQQINHEDEVYSLEEAQGLPSCSNDQLLSPATLSVLVDEVKEDKGSDKIGLKIIDYSDSED